MTASDLGAIVIYVWVPGFLILALLAPALDVFLLT